VAERAPVLAGSNVTKIEQLAPAFRVAGQLFVCVKSVAFVPLIAKPETVSGVVPVFVICTVVSLGVPTLMAPKPSVPGLKVACGLITIAVSGTDCGLFGALSTIFRIAVWVL
jgi:hypothetical protein